jgi:ankyrin repeat protein
VDGALDALRNPDMEVAIRQEAERENVGESESFAEATVSLSTRDETTVYDSDPSQGTVENLTDLIPQIDEATFDALLAKGASVVQPCKPDDERLRGVFVRDFTAVTKLASLGLTDYMGKVVTKAKLLDDFDFVKCIAESKNWGHCRVQPALQAACRRSVWNMDMVRLLVQEGQVDVNAREHIIRERGDDLPHQGGTALHVLAAGNFWWQVQAIKFLVENGELTDLLTNYPILSRGVLKVHHAGAHVDAVNERDQTPLDVACQGDHHPSQGCFRSQCCEILLQLGADPNRVNKPALSHAAGDTELVKSLIKHGAKVDATRPTVLASAIQARNVELVLMLLDSGVDSNRLVRPIGHSHDQHPLQLAVSYQHETEPCASEIVKILLDRGVRLDMHVEEGLPLIHALFSRYNRRGSKLIPLIKRQNVDFNLRDGKGRTAFMVACGPYLRYGGSTRPVGPPVCLLIADYHGPSIDYLAVDNEGKHMVTYLAEVWTEDVSAQFLPIPGVRELIRQKDHKGFSPLHYALRASRVQACLQLIGDGGDEILLEPDPNGNTALHHLCRFWFRANWRGEAEPDPVPLMQKFIDLGGSVNARNNVGETPLLAYMTSDRHCLRKSRAEEPDPAARHLQFFISNGADFCAKRDDGETALHLVTQDGFYSRRLSRIEDTQMEVFQSLVQLGCDPLQENGKGRTALDVAAAMGHRSILALYQRKK